MTGPLKQRQASLEQEFDTVRFSAAANAFIPLLRQHISKENQVLFPMAINLLNESDDAMVDERFTRVEQERCLAGLHEQYAAEIAHWETRMADEAGRAQ